MNNDEKIAEAERVELEAYRSQFTYPGSAQAKRAVIDARDRVSELKRPLILDPGELPTRKEMVERDQEVGERTDDNGEHLGYGADVERHWADALAWLIDFQESRHGELVEHVIWKSREKLRELIKRSEVR